MDIRKLFGAFGKDVLILLVMGGVLLYQSAPNFLVSFKPAVSFADMLDGKEVREGMYVKGDVIYVLDYFASESTYTQRQDGSRSGSKASGNYYLIPTAEGFIGLKSRQADVSVLDTITEETFSYMETGVEPTTTFYMEGSVEAMEGNLVNYYKEYLTDMGYTESEITAFGDPLVIRYVSFVAVRIMFAIGLVLVALAVLILYRRYHYESGLKKAEDLPG